MLDAKRLYLLEHLFVVVRYYEKLIAREELCKAAGYEVVTVAMYHNHECMSREFDILERIAFLKHRGINLNLGKFATYVVGHGEFEGPLRFLVR